MGLMLTLKVHRHPRRRRIYAHKGCVVQPISEFVSWLQLDIEEPFKLRRDSPNSLGDRSMGCGVRACATSDREPNWWIQGAEVLDIVDH